MPISRCFLVLIISFLCLSSAEAAWYNSSWDKRIKITIDDSQVNGTVANFPVYVNLNHLPASFFDDVLANGADLRVTKSDGVTEVAREVVYVDRTNNAGELHFIANGSLTNASNSDFYLYYKNPSATEPAAGATYGKNNVWSNNYVGVWHMNALTNGTASVTDSTSYVNHGVPYGGMTSGALVTGKTGNATSFDGSNDYIDVADSASLDITSALTLSAWVQPTKVTNNGILMKGSLSSSQGVYSLIVATAGSGWYFRLNGSTSEGSGQESGGSPQTNQWQYVVGTWTGTTMSFYIDTSQIGSSAYSTTLLTNNDSLKIGAYFSSSKTFPGLIDEVRIASVERNGSWVKTEYNNQNSPTNFYRVSAVESKPWYNSSWDKRIKITIDDSQVNGTVANFPVYVNLNHLPASFFDDVLANGADLRVTKSDGVTEVAREVVYVDRTNNAGELHFIANGSLTNASNSDFYLYYKNASATEPAAGATYGKNNVWSNSYVGVWHMNEDPSGGAGAIKDSTSYSNVGTSAGSMTSGDLVVGPLGKAIDFDGSNDTISISDSASLDITSGTLSVWVKPSHIDETGNWQDDNLILYKLGAYQLSISSYSGYEGRFQAYYFGSVPNESYGADLTGTANTKSYLVSTYDTANVKLYTNSSLDSTTARTGNIIQSSGILYLGWGDYSRYFTGLIDEVRIASVARNGSWVKTEYNNQNSPTSFYRVSTAEDKPWLGGAWSNRIKLEINRAQVNGSVANFPVYVNLNHLPASFFDTVLVNGADLRVTKSDGVTEVAREVVYVDRTNNAGELHFIANGTLTNASNGVFYLYYGNSAATEPAAGATYGKNNVWSNSYVGVWHMNALTNGTASVMDSTSYANHGTPYGAMVSGSDLVTGKTGMAIDFDGSNDYIQLGAASAVNNVSQVTITSWVKRSSSGALVLPFSNSKTSIDMSNRFHLGFWNDGVVYLNVSSGSSSYAYYGHNDANWHYAVMSFDGSLSGNANRLRGYLDGISQSLSYGGTIPAVTLNNTFNSPMIGRVETSYSNGLIDEVRISNAARNGSWIKTEYNNQNSPSTFYSIASTEARPKPDDWLGAAWANRIKLTVDKAQVNGSVANFPVYVNLNHLPASFFDTVLVNGADLRVTKSDGVTEVAREVVYVDKTNNAGELHFVANGTLSNASNGVFYLYYGNGTATEPPAGATYGKNNVWSNSYVGVWHFNQSPVNASAMVSDSTSYANTGTPQGAMDSNDLVTGKVGKAYDFDGTNDYVTAGTSAAAITGNQITVSAWVYAIANLGDAGVVGKTSNTSWSNGYGIYQIGGGMLGFFINQYSGNVASATLSTGMWHYVVGTYNGSTIRIYIDGVSGTDDSLTGNITDGGSLQFATMGGWTTEFNGRLDNTRISNVTRNGSWVKTEYNNQNSPTSFYIVSSVSSLAAPVLASVSPADDATGVLPSSNLVLNFDRKVVVGSGNIYIKKVSDNSTVHTISVTSGLVTGSGTTQITVNPSTDLTSGTAYYIQIDATAFDDTASYSYAGISDTSTWNFTVGAAANPFYWWGAP